MGILALVVCLVVVVSIYYATREEETTSPAGTPAPSKPGPATLTPLETLLASSKAIQIAEVDPATLSGTWGAAITPTDPTGTIIKYSFTMDVNLDSTWSTVAGSTYNVFKHGESPDFYINNGGAAGAHWGADATNGVTIIQTTVGASSGAQVGNKQYQVYRNNFTPGNGYKNITVVCDGTDIKYYVNGAEDTLISGAADRTNKTGIKWNTGAWTWGGMTGTASPPSGKSKIRNFYWWSDKALSDAERTTLLGNSATAGSFGASTYMPQPLSMGTLAYEKEGFASY
jgi:hypothetical protein